MLNNLVVDSELLYPRKSWIIDNARIKGTNPLQITSSKDTFGIHQTLYLRSKGRYYFRLDVSALKYVKEIIVGISSEGILRATKHYVNVNTSKFVSAIVDVKDASLPITLYLICTSRTDTASITISNPVLYKLDDLWLRFALKSYLDKKLKYFPSVSYDNVLSTSSLNTRVISHKINFDATVANLDKLGELTVSTRSSINITRRCNLQHCHLYLLKLLKEDVNKQGKVELYYNDEKGKELSDYQQYIYFIYNGVDLPYIKCSCKPNSKIDYRVILKKMLIIDMFDKKRFSEEEIKSLLFVE